MLEEAHIHVVDLTHLQSDDALNHGKFAESEVVKAIGVRLAAGQTLTDSRVSLGERLGAVALGATTTVGKAATLAVSTPLAVVDPETRESLGDTAGHLTTAASPELPQ